MSVQGESADLGNTFWQAHFSKNRKTHLGRGLVKPSTKVLISRPRFYQALDRGFVQSRALQTLGRGFVKTSTEVFKYFGRGSYLGRGLKKIDLAHIQTNEKFSVPCRGVHTAIPST